MKKISAFLILLASLCSEYTLAQDPKGGYHNLEKYWWYRYRLINDFLKIGPNCGESIPAQRRHKIDGYDTSGARNRGILAFEDATIDLGNYISMLSTEYAMLRNNGLPADRTKMELHYALGAFERIDQNAESYCENIDATYPCNPNSNDFLLHQMDFSSEMMSRKIFQMETTISTLIDLGVMNLNPTHNWIDKGAIVSRYWDVTATPPHIFVWPPIVRRMPQEESKDQVVQISMGMSLAAKLAAGASYVPGDDLGLKGTQNLERIVSYIHTADYGLYRWKIINPITHMCVYGVLPRSSDLF